MNTTQIVKKYYLCKNRIEIFVPELEALEESKHFVKVTKYGHEPGERIGIEDIYMRLLDKKAELEVQISFDKAFVEKIDRALNLMKRDFDQEDYEAFELKYFKGQKLAYLSVKYECSEGGVRKRIKKVSNRFESLVNLEIQ